MSLLAITCPKCGFSKEVDPQKIPADLKRLRCPKCQHAFPLEAREDTFIFHDMAPPVSNSATTPPRNANPSVPPANARFCSTCGKRIHANAEICPGCGVRVASSPHAINKVALLLITFFLGGFGGHKFYQKKYLAGVLYLLFFWTYIPGLIALVEFFVYAFKSEPELQRMYPETASGGAMVLAILVPFIGIAMIGILAAIAIPQFAAYREKAYSAAARSDLQSCKVQAESFFSRHESYPADSSQLQCRTSKGVSLYYLPDGANGYQLISFHGNGKKAFLSWSEGAGIEENSRDEIQRQIVENLGSSALEPSFHFVE